MTHRSVKSTATEGVMELLEKHGIEGFAKAMALVWNEALKKEREKFLGASAYERSESRIGHANGFKRKVVHSRAGALELEVPQVRGIGSETLNFYPPSLERGSRSERALKAAVAEMYIQGVSTRRVAKITRELCGLEVSSTQVSRLTQLLDEELKQWRERPLEQMPYMIFDARYDKVRHGGAVVDCAVLIAVGVRPNGKRTVLGVSVSLSEAEVHWRTFLEGLQSRGLQGVRYVVSDDHPGLKAALRACFPGVLWQRCQCHLQRNASAYVPRKEDRGPVAEDLRSIFHGSDREDAERKLEEVVQKWRPKAPRLADWMENNIPDGLNVLALPPAHRRRMATTNTAENLNKQIKHRTRVAQLFPNEAALLRLATAVLVEISDEWETEKTYLRFENA